MKLSAFNRYRQSILELPEWETSTPVSPSLLCFNVPQCPVIAYHQFNMYMLTLTVFFKCIQPCFLTTNSKASWRLRVHRADYEEQNQLI